MHGPSRRPPAPRRRKPKQSRTGWLPSRRPSRDPPSDDAAITAAEAELAAIIKQAREATNKAEQIEDAVYDLKAVNPSRKAEVDERTPAQLPDLIEAKGLEIKESIASLRALDRVV